MGHVFRKSNKRVGEVAFRALVLLGAAPIALSTAVPAIAQNFTTGALAGTVTNADGSAATEGTVTIRSAAQGFTRTATISNGAFRLSALPIGTYNITVAVPNQQEVIDTIVINAGVNNTYTFRVGTPVEEANGDIIVTGRAERGNDFGTVTSGLDIGNVSDLLNRTPIARDQTSLILLTPGVTLGDTAFGGRGNLASIGGATVAENAYYVNGLNVTNFRNFVGSTNPPIEFYETTSIKQTGLAAEYGRVLGGFVSTVTKSGSNDFKGGAIFAYQPDSLTNDAPNTYAAFNQDDYRENLEANFYLSGPIIKDRLFFYGLYNPNYSKTQDTNSISGLRLTERNSSPFFGGKVDLIVADGHRLEGTFFRNAQTRRTDYDRFDPATETYGAPLGTLVEKFGGNNFVGTYTGQFTPWLTLSASYGENHDDQSAIVSPATALVQSTLTGTTTTARGVTTSNSRDEDTRKFFRADGDVYASLLGDHHFRFGYERENLTSVSDTRYSGGYRYLLAPTYVYRYYYENIGTWKSKNDSFYFQDSWTLLDNRLNLQLGIRNDRFSNDSIRGETFFKSGNQWGPRLGASFDVFGDRRTTINGTWGRYYLPVATNTNIRLGGAELYYRQRFAYPTGVNPAIRDQFGLPTQLTYDAQGNIQGLTTRTGGISGPCPEVGPDNGAQCSNVSSDGVAGPTDTLVSSSLAPSYQDEWTIGLQHRIDDWQFGITYINRRLGRALDDVAIDAAVNAYCARNGIQGCDDVFSGFHQYVLANPGDDITVRLDGDCAADARQCEVATLSAADLGFPKPKRNYDSIQFAFSKAYTNNWSVGGSYVYTRVRGNYEGAVKSDNGQDDAGLTQDFDQPGLLEGAYGVLANQRAHAFKLFGSVGITDNFSLGANVLVESPRKFSCLGVYPDASNFAAAYENASFYCRQPQFSGNPAFTNTNTDPSSTSYLVPRSTAFESDWRKQIDVSARFSFPQLPNSFFSIDVFNVFNFKSKTDYNEFGDNADGTINQRFGQPLAYQQPRFVRFTLGIRLGERSETGDE